jgi:hypothetical protein
LEKRKKSPAFSKKRNPTITSRVMKNRVLSDTDFREMKIRRNQTGGGANELLFFNKKLTPKLTP